MATDTPKTGANPEVATPGSKQFTAPQPAAPGATALNAPPVAPPAAGQTPEPPPAPAGFVNVYVDGKHVVAGARDNLIEAAKRVDVEIPYFCYHPRLSIAGQCRMCLVETSDMPGRLVPGCQVRVKEGLKIITDTPAVIDNQRACMEFHLVNHPVDCPICDQAGECKLQDYYMAHDFRASRIGTFKVNKPKRKVFGPLVVYDGERCILCTRCVRFMNEVAREPQIAMVGRGDHSEIDTVPGKQLDSKYSGNTVDICPVGALLNRDFRFTSRVWYLDSVRSVCAGCANGCNVSVDYRADAVYRLLPKRNEEVNQVWLCDDGRVSYHRTMDDRVQVPREGIEAEGRLLTIDTAVQTAAKRLGAAKGQVAVALSATCSTEELFAAATFAREVLGAKRVYAIGRGAGQGDDFLIRADKNPNTQGVKLAAQAAGLELAGYDQLIAEIAAGRVKHALFVGAEVPADETKAAETLGALETFIVLAATRSPLTDAATLVLPLSTHHEFEGTFVNYYGRLQRFRRAIGPKYESAPAWSWVTRLSAAMDAGWTFATAADAFGLLAARHPLFQNLTLAGLPDTGVVLPGLQPAEYPDRAPRPVEAPTAA